MHIVSFYAIVNIFKKHFGYSGLFVGFLGNIDKYIKISKLYPRRCPKSPQVQSVECSNVETDGTVRLASCSAACDFKAFAKNMPNPR
jgi:hypothetical protein